MNLRDLLTPIDHLMQENGIAYAVIGGYGVAAWGDVRATRDVDILFGAGDLETLESALRQSGIDFERRTGDADDPISEVIRIRRDAAGIPYEVDLLAGIRGAPPGLLTRTRSVSLGDLRVPVASPEDMIVLKLLGGSVRDLDDARSILRIQKQKLDLALLRRLCPEFLRQCFEALLSAESGA